MNLLVTRKVPRMTARAGHCDCPTCQRRRCVSRDGGGVAVMWPRPGCGQTGRCGLPASPHIPRRQLRPSTSYSYSPRGSLYLARPPLPPSARSPLALTPSVARFPSSASQTSYLLLLILNAFPLRLLAYCFTCIFVDLYITTPHSPLPSPFTHHHTSPCRFPF